MFNQELYRETFAQVQASEETLAEVLKMTKNKKNSFGRLTRALLIAAVLTAMLTTTAFAYVGFTQYENPMQMLKTFFGGEEYSVDEGGVHIATYKNESWTYVEPTVEHVPMDTKVAEEDVAPYVSDVGQSITHDGDTLTVEAHLYDSATYCGVIYYTIENPNGVSGYEVQDNGEIWWPGGEKVYISDVGNGKGCYIVEDETTQTKLTVAFYYCGAEGVDCVKVAFYADESSALVLPMNDGGGMKGLSLADGDIALSPIAIRVNAKNMEFLYENLGIYCDITQLVIRYADDTEYVVYSDDPYIDNSTYALNSYDGTIVSYTFNRLIDIDAVEAVIINGVEFTDISQLTDEQRTSLQPEQKVSVPAGTESAYP